MMERGKTMGPIADRLGVGAPRQGRDASDARRGYGVVLNPRKAQPITLTEDDKVIVLAEA